MIRTLSILKYAAIALVCTVGASAAPPEAVDPSSPLAQWYRSLRAPNSDTLCCGIADCRPIQARQAEDHWEILIGNVWVSVPEERILKRYNMDGRPIACMSVIDDDPAGNERIQCFVPPPET